MIHITQMALFCIWTKTSGSYLLINLNDTGLEPDTLACTNNPTTGYFFDDLVSVGRPNAILTCPQCAVLYDTAHEEARGWKD